MKQIALNGVNGHGLFTLVDDEDYEELNKVKWYGYKAKNTVYAVRGGNRIFISMHREILKVPPKLRVDHIDHNGLNNQKSNIRICTASENNKNCTKRINKTSKYIGVSWHKTTKKWQVKSKYKGKVVFGGLYANEDDAGLAYNRISLEQCKDFTNINIIKP